MSKKERNILIVKDADNKQKQEEENEVCDILVENNENQSRSKKNFLGQRSNDGSSHNDHFTTPDYCIIFLNNLLRLPKNTVVWDCCCGEKHQFAKIFKMAGIQTVLESDVKGKYYAFYYNYF